MKGLHKCFLILALFRVVLADFESICIRLDSMIKIGDEIKLNGQEAPGLKDNKFGPKIEMSLKLTGDFIQPTELIVSNIKNKYDGFVCSQSQEQNQSKLATSIDACKAYIHAVDFHSKIMTDSMICFWTIDNEVLTADSIIVLNRISEISSNNPWDLIFQRNSYEYAMKFFDSLIQWIRRTLGKVEPIIDQDNRLNDWKHNLIMEETETGQVFVRYRFITGQYSMMETSWRENMMIEELFKLLKNFFYVDAPCQQVIVDMFQKYAGHKIWLQLKKQTSFPRNYAVIYELIQHQFFAIDDSRPRRDENKETQNENNSDKASKKDKFSEKNSHKDDASEEEKQQENLSENDSENDHDSEDRSQKNHKVPKEHSQKDHDDPEEHSQKDHNSGDDNHESNDEDEESQSQSDKSTKKGRKGKKKNSGDKMSFIDQHELLLKIVVFGFCVKQINFTRPNLNGLHSMIRSFLIRDPLFDDESEASDFYDYFIEKNMDLPDEVMDIQAFDGNESPFKDYFDKFNVEDHPKITASDEKPAVENAL